MSEDPIQRALAEAQQRTRAEQQLAAMLRATLHQPAVIKRASPATLVEIVREGAEAMLLVALPNGERWDIPLNAHQQGILHREMTLACAPGDTAEEQEQA